jgi:hypothetical protein
LASGVTASSLTSVGTLTGLTTSGNIDGPQNFIVGNGEGEFIYFQGSSNQVFIQSNGTYRAYWNSSGHYLPYADSSYDLGGSSIRWRNAYFDSINTTGNSTVGGKLTVTGDMVADDVQATTGVFYGGGSDSSQPNEYMQFSESSNYWRVVNDGGEDFRVDSSGYAYTQGRRYYFGIGSNDYIRFDEGNNEYDFISDGTQRVRVGGGVLLDTSGQSYWSLSPPTGTGNDAEWTAAFGYYYLRRNSSTASEKVNIQTDLEGWLTPQMIDSVVPKMWARTETPDYPEIGPIAEDMDAISPFLGTKGTDADGEVFLNGIDRNAYLSLLVLAVKDLRARVAELESTP